MAHHLAEQLHQTEHAQGNDRQAAEDRAVALTLKIWASRRDAPGMVDPLRRLESVLAVMDRMRAEAWPYRRHDDKLVNLLTRAFDGLRTLVWAAVLQMGLKDGEALDADDVAEFLEDDERAVLERVNEWVAFLNHQPAPRPPVRIVTSEEEAAALKAEDERESEIDALPDPDRALKRLDQELDRLIETLTILRTELAAVHEHDGKGL